MKLVPVEALPGKRLKHRLQDLIKEFVESDAEIVKIDFNEHDYVSAKVCRSCLGIAIKTSGYNVRAHIRGEEVYMCKIIPKD